MYCFMHYLVIVSNIYVTKTKLFFLLKMHEVLQFLSQPLSGGIPSCLKE